MACSENFGRGKCDVAKGLMVVELGSVTSGPCVVVLLVNARAAVEEK